MFGKSTTANLLYNILMEKGMNVELFHEGNLDHPADYDGVACFTKSEFNSLVEKSGNFRDAIHENVTVRGNDYILPYSKMKNEYGTDFPDDFFLNYDYLF